jgi:tetratricopeptide (TPR) repeat protein
MTAEEMLRRALLAPTPRSRALWARRGLSLRGPLDRTTQSMLLRQLYLAYFETRRFEKAIEISEQLVALGVLRDVAHQDAARAKQAQGDIEGAVQHLRLAARAGPANRRAFHWWTLGSVYYLARRYDEAIGALKRAARWGTRDKPLYQGHLAVAQCENGMDVHGLGTLITRLSEVPAGQGYGRFVLGQMAYFDRRWDEAKKYLESFVQRSSSGRAAVAIALEGELEVARKTLAAIPKR